jgi:hypothetical protein
MPESPVLSMDNSLLSPENISKLLELYQICTDKNFTWQLKCIAPNEWSLEILSNQTFKVRTYGTNKPKLLNMLLEQGIEHAKELQPFDHFKDERKEEFILILAEDQSALATIHSAFGGSLPIDLKEYINSCGKSLTIEDIRDLHKSGMLFGNFYVFVQKARNPEAVKDNLCNQGFPTSVMTLANEIWLQAGPESAMKVHAKEIMSLSIFLGYPPTDPI